MRLMRSSVVIDSITIDAFVGYCFSEVQLLVGSQSFHANAFINFIEVQILISS